MHTCCLAAPRHGASASILGAFRVLRLLRVFKIAGYAARFAALIKIAVRPALPSTQRINPPGVPCRVYFHASRTFCRCNIS